MKCIVAISLLFALSQIVVAQPVITRGDLLIPGEDLFFNYPDIIPADPGPAGADVLWDFSAIIPNSASVNITIVQADTTPYIVDYPDANIALRSEGFGVTSYQYFDISDAGWQELGNVVADFSTLTYINPLERIQFPLTYNTQWQDSYTSLEEFQTSPVTTSGEGMINAVVDGYGTLMLPHATIDDAIRVRYADMNSDTTDLGQGLSEKNVNQDTFYLWLSPSYHGPLCYFEKNFQVKTVYLTTQDTVITDMEINESESFFLDPSSGSSGIRDVIQPGKYALDVSPNPFEKSINVNFVSEQPNVMSFQLQDLNGKKVYQTMIHAVSGENNVVLNLPTMPSGSYIAMLQSGNIIDIQKLIRINGKE